MNAPRIRSLNALSSSTISRELVQGDLDHLAGIPDDPREIEPLADDQAELPEEAVGPLDGDDPIFLTEPLDDRHGSRLDDEEVAALVSRGEQHVAGLDRANAPELSQSRPLVLVEARKCPVAIDGLRFARSDWLGLVVQRFVFSSFAGTI